MVAVLNALVLVATRRLVKADVVLIAFVLDGTLTVVEVDDTFPAGFVS